MSGLLGTGVATDLGIPDEHDRSGGRVHRLVGEREGRASGEHDVHLLVAERPLGVFLDDIVAGIPGDVRIDPERADVECSSDRLPQQRAVHHRHRLELVEAQTVPARGHQPVRCFTETGRAYTR